MAHWMKTPRGGLSGTPAEHRDAWQQARTEVQASVEDAKQAMAAGNCVNAGVAIDAAYVAYGQMVAHAGTVEELQTSASLHKAIKDADEPFEKGCVRGEPLEASRARFTQRPGLAGAPRQRRATKAEVLKHAMEEYNHRPTMLYLWGEAKAGDGYAWDELESFLPMHLDMPAELDKGREASLRMRRENAARQAARKAGGLSGLGSLARMKSRVLKEIDEWGDATWRELFKKDNRYAMTSPSAQAYNARVRAAVKELVAEGVIEEYQWERWRRKT